MTVESFPAEIHKDLEFYVYRLIDPRDGSTFYIGKGRGDRVFSHVRAMTDLGEYEDEDALTLKLKTIREILSEGLSPLHIIHRHGMTEDESFLAEAVLIDATPGLTNVAGGHGSNDQGPANAEQLIRRYQAGTMKIDPSHHVIAINVRKSHNERESLYHAVRFAWRISIDRATKADFIFAVTNGICMDVYVPEKWMPATVDNFPTLTSEDVEGRYGFEGVRATDGIQAMYRGKRLPEAMQRKRGMASPILYSYS